MIRSFLIYFNLLFLSFSVAFSQGFTEKNKNSKNFAISKSISKNSKENSALSVGDWYKLGVDRTGIYKITGADLKTMGIQLSSLKTSDIAIYGNQAGMISENNAQPYESDLHEYAIFVEDVNKNGKFDSEDYILFYGESPNVWEYNQSGDKFDYKIHPYSFQNYYFLTVSEGNSTNKRIKITQLEQVASTHEANTFIDYFVHEKELQKHSELKSGRQWLGEKINSKGSSFSFSVPNIVKTRPVDYSVVVASGSTSGATVSLKINNGNASTITMGNAGGYVKYVLGEVQKTFSPTTDNIDFNLTYNASGRTAEGWLKKITFTAWRNLKLSNGQMNFRNTEVVGSGNVTKFSIQKTMENLRVWDVTDMKNAYEIKYETGQNDISFVIPTDLLKEFVVFDNSRFLSPDFKGKVENQNLHGLSLTEYIIVTHSQFKAEAERLAEIHRRYNDLHTTVVTTAQVYNEFSSGKQDPMAIRRFAKMFYDRVSSLSETEKGTVPNIRYLLLFGDGHYDNKNIENSNTCFIVTYQSENSHNEEMSIVGDQYFGYLENNSTLTLGIGRFTANNLSEAKVFVDKVERYMLKKDLTEAKISGNWRNYIGIVTDDFDERETYFVSYAEHLANKLTADHPVFNLDKIYADSYKQQTNSHGAYYPDANNAIKKRMNDGAIVLNYIGHGAYTHLGIEHFIPQNDISNYTNKYALPLVVTSTCDFGMFDRTSEKCGAENFVLNSGGGAIAVISAARKVHSNAGFNTCIISTALESKDGVQYAIGDALRIAKNTYPNADIPSFNLIGDPALKLSLPNNKALVTKINSSEIEYTDTTISVATDTMKALSRMTIEGIIVDENNRQITDFDGRIYGVVFDKQENLMTLANDVPGTETSFVQQKNRIYQGSTEVKGGKFKFSFMAPLCIRYNFDYGKISLYAKTEKEDARGYYKQLIVGGVNEGEMVVENNTRPEIKLFMNDTTFRSGGMTDKNPRLVAQLFDEHGLNYSGACLGKSIEAWLDDQTQEILSLNDFYEQNENDARKGIINYSFSNLSAGKHKLTLRASNVFNLTSETTIDFVVDSSGIFETGKVYNFPNPLVENTTFVCEINNQEPIKSAEIQVFDTKGKLMKTMYPIINNSSYSIVHTWNGKTDRGGKLENGVYIYRFVIITESGEKRILSNKLILFSK